MLNKTVPLVALLFLCIILGTAEAAGTSGAIRTVSTTSDPAPCTISVLFANGLNSATYSPLSNFTVYINITNCPGIGYYDLGIQWNPALLEIGWNTTSYPYNNTADDVIQGTFMSNFGSTVFPGPSLTGTDLPAGYMSDIPCGFYAAGVNATGSGTLFTILFHCIASGNGNISIMAPNVISYLLDPTLTQLVTIGATVNGSLVVVIPEFPASALLPVFLVVTTIIVATATLASRKRQILPRILQRE